MSLGRHAVPSERLAPVFDQSMLCVLSDMTHQVGKWDAGMATFDHTPHGRGYDTSLGYFHHVRVASCESHCSDERAPLTPRVLAMLATVRRTQDNDYYNDMDAPFVDLWDTVHPAFGMNSSCETFYDGKHGCEQPGTNPAYTVGPEMIYEEKIFVDRCLEMVDDHPSPSVPFFLNYCSHIVHSPLQAPANLYHTFDFMKNDYDKHRQIYASMVAYLDTGVGKIVDALTDSHMVNDHCLSI